MDQYNEVSGSSIPGLTARETQLLMKISEAEVIDFILESLRNKEKKKIDSIPNSVSKTTQTIDKRSKKDKQAKKDSPGKGGVCVSSSTQTESSACNSTACQLEMVVPSFSRNLGIKDTTSTVSKSAESNAARSRTPNTSESDLPMPSQTASTSKVRFCNC